MLLTWTGVFLERFTWLTQFKVTRGCKSSELDVALGTVQQVQHLLTLSVLSLVLSIVNVAGKGLMGYIHVQAMLRSLGYSSDI